MMDGVAMEKDRIQTNKQLRYKVKIWKKYYSDAYFCKRIGLTRYAFKCWICSEKGCLSNIRERKLKQLLEAIKEDNRGISLWLLQLGIDLEEL